MRTTRLPAVTIPSRPLVHARRALAAALLAAAIAACDRRDADPLSPRTTRGIDSTDAESTAFPTSRDVYRWPFAQQSPWNLPIGNGAVYVPAGFQRANWMGVDRELIVRAADSDPLVPVYAPGSWERRCSGTSNPQWDWIGGLRLRLPASLVVPDAAPPSTPNNVTTIIQPDGRSLVGIAPFARCEAGGPAYGWTATQANEPLEDIFADGLRGAHGGSGLSGLGGSIRLGELTGNDPIRHALKLNVWAQRYLFYDAADGTPGYRWPARNADNYAAGVYGGRVRAVEQGTLLAIPPSISLASLGLVTRPGRRIARALQDYGAYIVDDSAWDAYDLNAEAGVAEEFAQRYGYPMSTNSGPWFEDMMRIVAVLHAVDNNTPATIGGGGVRRRPLAPPFAP